MNLLIGAVFELTLSSIALLGDWKALVEESNRLAIAGRFMVCDDVNREAHALKFDLNVLIYG